MWVSECVCIIVHRKNTVDSSVSSVGVEQHNMVCKYQCKCLSALCVNGMVPKHSFQKPSVTFFLSLFLSLFYVRFYFTLLNWKLGLSFSLFVNAWRKQKIRVDTFCVSVHSICVRLFSFLILILLFLPFHWCCISHFLFIKHSTYIWMWM